MDANLQPDISVVIPVYNEAGNIEPLVREIAATLAGRRYEILFVDDCSTDATGETVLSLQQAGVAPLRLVRHSRRSGQSAGLCTGVQAARATQVVTLDGDGQNDPADIPAMLAAVAPGGAQRPALAIGHRVNRNDTAWRRFQSRVANRVRASLLRDDTPDTGCGLKAFDRATFLALPQFDHMHRFLPALFRRSGARVISVPVRHRPRLRGTSKYGMFDRLWVGIVDMFGVMWLARRGWQGLETQEIDRARP